MTEQPYGGRILKLAEARKAYISNTMLDIGPSANLDYVRRAADAVFGAMMGQAGRRRTPSKFAERLRSEARRFERLEGWRSECPAHANYFHQALLSLADEVQAGAPGRPRGAASSHTSMGRKWAKAHVAIAVESFNKHVRHIGREDLVGEVLRPGISAGPGLPIKASWGRRVLFKILSAARKRFGGEGVTDADIRWAIGNYYKTYRGPIGNVYRLAPRRTRGNRPVN